MVLQAAQERTSPASIQTPAYLQALYQQRLAQEASSQRHSVQRRSQEAASRHESIELGAPEPSAESPRFAWQASGPWPTDEEVLQQQQIKCTVMKALLQLSPLVAEEPRTDQTSAKAFVYELMPDNERDLHDEGSQAELRQLCIATLAALAAQPQSISSLFELPTPEGRAAPTELQHCQPVHRHTLLVMIFERMREASLHKQQVMPTRIEWCYTMHFVVPGCITVCCQLTWRGKEQHTHLNGHCLPAGYAWLPTT